MPRNVWLTKTCLLWYLNSLQTLQFYLVPIIKTKAVLKSRYLCMKTEYTQVNSDCQYYYTKNDVTLFHNLYKAKQVQS